MPKNDHTFDPASYAPVAERIRLFYAAFPDGRIVSRLVSRTDRDVVFKAAVYRNSKQRRPAATGWAAEREGDGDINLVACLENTETSAIGRALANLGFTASRERPSAEEMMKTTRARARLSLTEKARREISAAVASDPPSLRMVQADGQRRSVSGESLQREADDVVDALTLLRSAERFGLRAARAERIRATLVASTSAPAQRDRWVTLLRHWLEKRRIEAFSDPYLL